MPRPPSRATYPVFLALEGRDVLVVGAGPAAVPKVQALVDEGARVRVVAPEATDAIGAMARDGVVRWEARAFRETDLDAVWFVVSATNDPEAARAIAERAASLRLFVLAVDDPANGTAASGSGIARPPFVVAISSSGEAPALTRLLREILEQVLPEDRWIEAARALRRRWRAEGTPMASRFAELVREFKSSL